jgi:uncharacterized protein YjiS (DUF1127 family)
MSHDTDTMIYHGIDRPIEYVAVPIRWFRAFTDWRERRRAIAELHSLNDRALHDIGLSRSEIEFMVIHDGHDPTRRPRS